MRPGTRGSVSTEYGAYEAIGGRGERRGAFLGFHQGAEDKINKLVYSLNSLLPRRGYA